jgi:putative membrane protein
VRRVLLTLVTNCAGLALASVLIPSISYHHRLGTLVLAGLILGIVNVALRPLVILLTLPAVILSFGIALLFINSLMLWVTSRIVSGFHVGGLAATVGAAVIMWLLNMALRPWTRPHRERRPSRDRRR